PQPSAPRQQTPSSASSTQKNVILGNRFASAGKKKFLEIDLQRKLRQAWRQDRADLLPRRAEARIDREDRGRVERVVQLEPRLDARVPQAEQAIDCEVHLVDACVTIERPRVDGVDVRRAAQPLREDVSR